MLVRDWNSQSHGKLGVVKIFKDPKITPLSSFSELETIYVNKCRNQANKDQNFSFINVSRSEGHSLDMWSQSDF